MTSIPAPWRAADAPAQRGESRPHRRLTSPGPLLSCGAPEGSRDRGGRVA